MVYWHLRAGFSRVWVVRFAYPGLGRGTVQIPPAITVWSRLQIRNEGLEGGEEPDPLGGRIEKQKPTSRSASWGQGWNRTADTGIFSTRESSTTLVPFAFHTTYSFTPRSFSAHLAWLMKKDASRAVNTVQQRVDTVPSPCVRGKKGARCPIM